MTENNNTKCSFISIVGSPNVGKSTLLNNIVGSKVSIVSPKVQTTRTLVQGITTKDNTQLIFIDTPGIFRPKTKLEKFIVKNAWSGVEDIDFVVYLVDATKNIGQNNKDVIEGLEKRKLKKILVINKIDLVKPHKLLELTQELNNLCEFDSSFMISASRGDGVSDLVKYLIDNANESPWYYDADDLTNLPKKILAEEIVREKLFLKLNEELPYNLTVQSESWEEFDNGDAKIHIQIITARANHKNMIIGKHGQKVKEIGEAARKELTEILDQKIHLFLHVKVKEDWLEHPERYISGNQ